MSSSTSRTKATVLAQVQALVAGTQKHTPNGSFTIEGVSYTAAALVQLFQSLGAAITDVNEKQASARAAVSAADGVKAKVVPVMVAYRRLLRTTYGNDPQTLGDYGVEPTRARTPLTGEQMAAARAKAEATRKARGTTSRKQKLAVKGDVMGVNVTPVTTSSPPSPSTQPASATTGAPSAPKS